MGALVSSQESLHDKNFLKKNQSVRSLLGAAEPIMKRSLRQKIVLEIISATGISVESSRKTYLSVKIHVIQKRENVATFSTKSSERYNTDSPVWHSIRPVCEKVSANDIIRFELISKTKKPGRVPKIAIIGKANYPVARLLMLFECSPSNCIEISLRPGETSKLRLRLLLASESSVSRRIFFIRHGESIYNEAQASRDIVTMFNQTDHPLNNVGILEAKKFNETWNNSINSPVADERLNSFKNATKIYSSPLSRAIQTAYLGLKDHQAAKMNGIYLLSSIREIQKFGGMDSKGSTYGHHISQRALNNIEKQGNQVYLEKHELAEIEVHPFDSETHWGGCYRENQRDIFARLRDFLYTIQYLEDISCIIVGHSLIFKKLFQFCLFMPKEQDIQGQELMNKLREQKIPNLGCVCVDFTFEDDWPQPIYQNLHPEKKKVSPGSLQCESSCESPMIATKSVIEEESNSDQESGDIKSLGEKKPANLFHHVKITNVHFMFSCQFKRP